MIRSPPKTIEHIPQLPTLRREWLRLHRRHLRALRNMDRVPTIFRHCADAVMLADKKYALYRRDYDLRLRLLMGEPDSRTLQ